MNQPAYKALVEVLHRALEEAAAESPLSEVVPEVKEFGAGEVEKLLGRGHGWAARHALELGGYRANEGGRLHFPLHAIRRYQERLAAEQARAGLRVAS